MNNNVKELKNLIVEKNAALDNLYCSRNSDRQKIEQAKRELDTLLYTFYKDFLIKRKSS